MARSSRNSGRRLRKPRSSFHLWPIFLSLMVLGVLGVGGAAAGVVGAYWYYSRDLPSPDVLAQRELTQSSKIYDRDGHLLYEVFDPQSGMRTAVPLSQISPHVIEATIATEDADFYNNPGINVRGIARVVWQNMTGREKLAGGGSSITQQLVKNVLIPERERSQRLVSRKIKEWILAFEITRLYNKDLILEWYLNEIYYGNFSYGIEAAAQRYFSKSAKDLTLAESAMLAGLPQAPSLYSPLTNSEAAKARQAVVLDLMVRQGYVAKEEAEAAKEEELTYATQSFTFEAPHFVNYIRDLLLEKYGPELVYRGGLKVTTTLDLNLQQEAEGIIREHLPKLENNNANNAALVSINPKTGEILTMVGSLDYFKTEIDGQVNMAIAERQPGSAFKPFNYITAFAKGYSPATMLLDIPSSFPNGSRPPYQPLDIDKKFRGPVSVRQALAQSLNVPAVRTLAFAGVKDVIDTAHKMGITSLDRDGQYGLSLTLGGGEVKLLDMVYAYGVLANGGVMAGTPVSTDKQRSGYRTLDPVAILKVEGPQGNILEEYTTPQTKPVVSAQLAYLITDILSDNDARAPIFGSNSPLKLPDRPAAVKTGTTEDWTDNWTIGYTPDLVTGVWIGNANYESMYQVLGVTAAGPIWHNFMVAAHQGIPAHRFPVPPGLVKAPICVPSGLQPTPQCPTTREEIFIQGTEPKQKDNMYQLVRIDKRTGNLATPQTPPQFIEEKVFMVLPPEAQEWALQNNIPQPPASSSAVERR